MDKEWKCDEDGELRWLWLSEMCGKQQPSHLIQVTLQSRYRSSVWRPGPTRCSGTLRLGSHGGSMAGMNQWPLNQMLADSKPCQRWFRPIIRNSSPPFLHELLSVRIQGLLCHLSRTRGGCWCSNSLSQPIKHLHAIFKKMHIAKVCVIVPLRRLVVKASGTSS